MNVDLSLSCGDYDLTQALIDGDVSPKGINLVTLDYPTPERNWRMVRHGEFDICELSMGSYLTAMAHVDERQYTAIPVFPHRRFRHSYFFTHTGSGISDPGDLEGKNVGLRVWQNTASIWMRGIAHEYYDLDLESVTWYLDDEDDEAIEYPDQFSINHISGDKNIEALLIDEELDAVMYPVVLDSVKDPDSNVVRMFDDSLGAEQRYYEQSGMFPIMHTVVINNDIVDKHPWVPINILKAFQQSIDICLQKLEDPRWTALAWARQHLEHQQSVLGTNPWPCGLTPSNRNTLDKLQDYAKLIGIIDHPFEYDELFIESTLDDQIGEKEYVSGV